MSQPDKCKQYSNRHSDKMAKKEDIDIDEKLSKFKDEIIDSIKLLIQNETNNLRNSFETSMKELSVDINLRMNEICLKMENNTKMVQKNKANISELSNKCSDRQKKMMN